MSARRRKATWLARLYSWANHRLYNEFAWTYDTASWLVSLGYLSGWRRMALDYVTGRHLLEVGFGTGELLIEMSRRNLRAYGLECSPAMQRVTARKMCRREVGAPRVRGITQRMPFLDGYFDSIVSTFPAEYIADPATLREIARLSRRPDPGTATGGGCLIVVGMYPHTDSLLLRRAIRLIFGVPAEHILARHEQIATEAGLRTAAIVPDSNGMRIPVVISERCPNDLPAND